MIKSGEPLDRYISLPAPIGEPPKIVWPIAVDAAGAGALFHLSERQWWRAHSAGKVPLPIRVAGRSCRWRIDELRRWAESGAPPRDKWNELQAGSDGP